MELRNILLLFVLLSTTLLTAVQTVNKVDLNRYLGKWYQYAYYPNSFQPKDAALSAAEYSLDSKGKIVVVNTSYKDKAGTQVLKEVSGKAYATDDSFSKLKVSFFWPFYGDYWIVKLDKDYQYSVVSDRKQKYLWILSRNPKLDKASYTEILQFLKKGGWDTGKIVVTGIE